MRRQTRVAVLALTGMIAGCLEDRERPTPVAPEPQASLSIEVLEPRAGITLIAGREVTVVVSGRDLNGDNLLGVGFVARRFGSGNNATVDSVAEFFDATNLATVDFAFPVPASLPTNTQLDIFGIAYGPGTQTRLSVPISVIVAQCQPGQPGC